MEDALMLENQVCFPLYAISRAIIQRYRPFLDKLDLTYPQYLVMMVLWEHKEQTINQLGEKLRLDSGTLTPLLKRMEQKSLICRIRSKADERVVDISLTEEGEAMREEARHIPQQMLEAIGITHEELLQLKYLTHKILCTHL